jgi:hypothetical protein
MTTAYHGTLRGNAKPPERLKRTAPKDQEAAVWPA